MERRGPTFGNSLTTLGGRDGMTKTSISLQDLIRRIYVKAKADKHKRFWGLYVHVCKTETLRQLSWLRIKSGRSSFSKWFFLILRTKSHPVEWILLNNNICNTTKYPNCKNHEQFSGSASLNSCPTKRPDCTISILSLLANSQSS